MPSLKGIRLWCVPLDDASRLATHSPPWHFAGTWWWVRNAALFRRNWRDVDGLLWGAESYPDWKFSIEESACLFFDRAETGHLYDVTFWRQAIFPALAHWRSRLAACGLTALGDGLNVGNAK